ncbi:MAG TPA: ABC transporter ATP-binding protein [Gemmatimonadales bacterium]
MTTTRRYLALLRPYWWLFALSLLGEFVASAMDGLTVLILVPLFNGLFGTAGPLDAGSTALEPFVRAILSPVIGDASGREAAGRIGLLLVTVLVVKNTVSIAARQASAVVEEGVVRDLRQRLFRHLLSLDLGFFQRTRLGQLVSGIITDTDGAKVAIPTALAALFRNLVIILTLFGILVATSWRLTLVTLAAAPLLLIGVRFLITHLKRSSRAWTEQRAELTGTVTERLAAIRLIRGYGQEGREIRGFAEQTDRYRRRVVKTQRYAAFPGPMTEIFGGLVLILVIWVSTSPTLMGGALGPTMTIVFVVTALRIMSPLKAITQVPASLALAFASAERVFHLLDEPPAERDEPGALPARFERELVFDRVSFRYSPDEDPVLEDVSFTIPKGRVVAVVGPSGAGKTTLLDLVPRFYEPTEGEIRLDGVPLSRLSRRSLRGLIGVVSQDVVILNDSVLANIAYGDPAATRDEVEAAARAANAADFIADLPWGYDTLLGERGTRLSGGQRQRIAIARALLRDPPILLLDEATSALDTESERLVQEAIERLLQDRTVLVVAHRLATIRDADEILVLERGRLIERGSHDALFAQSGVYRRLHDLQFRTAEVSV